MKLLASTALLIGISAGSAAAQQPINVTLPGTTSGVSLRPSDKLETQLQGKMDHAYGNAWRHLEGQPFVQRSWQPGEIVMNNKQRLGDLLLQYDAYGQQLLGVHKGKTDTLLLDHNSVQSFVVKDELSPDRLRTFRRFENAVRPEQRLNYVEVLHAGHYSLLKHHGRQLHRASDAQALNGDTNNDRIAEVYTYFLSRPDGTAVPVKLNAKSLSGAAPELAAAIKAALASKKTDNTEAGMASLLDSVDKAQ
ncbi:hypothetical protein [Hymenobacter edaphi]|uniref:Uncharacterized protein n=1 Tax=Hymenobacter edaphi TaxID=2211146 RepID=A0A328BQY5_9BACT|nr:hypothetical protein [Hymenobacter edaphi]RAK68416.1 hypothetical protein DLM85_10395 [Hymenobacter edaphi]